MLHIVLLKHFNLLDPPWNGSILRVEGALGGNTATVQYHRIPTVHPFPFPDVKVQVHEESWRYEDISYLIHRMHTVMWLTCTSGMSSARDVPGKGPKGKAFGSSVLGAHHRLVGKWAGWWPLHPQIQFSEQNRTYRTISNQADVYNNLLWTLAKCRAMPSLKFVCRIVVCSVCSGVVSALPVLACSCVYYQAYFNRSLGPFGPCQRQHSALVVSQ